MPKTATHNAIMLRCPPGTRFSIHGADVELQFERGREAEVLEFLEFWIDMYVRPEIMNTPQPVIHVNSPPQLQVTQPVQALPQQVQPETSVQQLAFPVESPTTDLQCTNVYDGLRCIRHARHAAPCMLPQSAVAQAKPVVAAPPPIHMNSAQSLAETKLAAMNQLNPPNPTVPGHVYSGDSHIKQASGPVPTASTPTAPNIHIPVDPKIGMPVYGPNGPMTPAEIAALPDKPIPGVGYVSREPPVVPTPATTAPPVENQNPVVLGNVKTPSKE